MEIKSKIGEEKTCKYMVDKQIKEKVQMKEERVK